METKWTFEELDLEGALRMVIEDVHGILAVREYLNVKLFDENLDAEAAENLKKDFDEYFAKFIRYQQVRRNLIDLLY